MRPHRWLSWETTLSRRSFKIPDNANKVGEGSLSLVGWRDDPVLGLIQVSVAQRVGGRTTYPIDVGTSPPKIERGDQPTLRSFLAFNFEVEGEQALPQVQ